MEVIIKSSDRLNKRHMAVFCRHIVLLLTLLCQHKGSVTTSALVIVIIHLVSISKKSVGKKEIVPISMGVFLSLLQAEVYCTPTFLSFKRHS